MSAANESTRVEQAIELGLLLHIADRRRRSLHLSGSMWIYEMAGTGTKDEIDAAARALDSLLRQGMLYEEGGLIFPTKAALDELEQPY